MQPFQKAMMRTASKGVAAFVRAGRDSSASSVARCISIPATLRPATCVPVLQQMHQRNLSTTAKTIVKSERVPNLVEMLSTEIASENANDEIDQEFLESKEAMLKYFTIEDEPGSNVVQLFGKHGKEKVVVSFNCQDEVGGDMDMAEEEYAPRAEGEEEPDDSVGISFEVSVIRGGGKLKFECVALDSVHIEALKFVPDGKAEDDRLLYDGPVFDTLDESLQAALYRYLEERRIDNEMCYFVQAYAREKEQREYVNWLEKLRDFVGK